MNLIRCECGRHVDTDHEKCKLDPNTKEMICRECYKEEACHYCGEWNEDTVVCNYSNHNYCESCA